MLLHKLACLADHFVDENLGLLSVAISSQQREVCRPHAVVGITPCPGAYMPRLGKTGCNEHFQCMFDLVVVSSNQRVLATDVPQSVAVRDDGDVETPVAELHRDHGVPGFVVGDCLSCS